jgi:c-di-GMP-binding flagellar brake protein YcgR
MDKDLTSKDIIARKFTLGQIFDIEVPDAGRTRFQSPLVGMREGKYLLAELPSLTRHGNLRDQLVERQQIIIRTICEKTTGECLGFKSFIQAKLKQPDQLMFLSFPASVQIHELRDEKRMLVQMEAKLVCNQGERIIFGILTDLSAGGCRFEYEAGAEAPPAQGDAAEVCFEHPETGRIENRIVIVRSARSHQTTLRVGLAFEKEQAADHLK